MEYTLAGWSKGLLAREAGVHYSVIKRWEDGLVTNPLLSLIVAVAKPLGLRLDFVAPRHLPLLELDEFEIAALVDAAVEGWRVQDCDHPQESQLLSALTKLGKINKGVSSDAA